MACYNASEPCALFGAGMLVDRIKRQPLAICLQLLCILRYFGGLLQLVCRAAVHSA